MRAEATDLIEEGGRVVGLGAKTPDGRITIRADLVVGCDGRHSTVREKAGLKSDDYGAPMDVLWFHLSRKGSDSADTFGHIEAGKLMVMLDRAWWDATLATDPIGSKMNPPMLRAPNGVREEFANNWVAGKAYYDPSKITVPTFLIHAEWDVDVPSYQVQNYFKQLTNVPYKQLVELGEGTHTVMLEKNRMQFFREVMGFLSENDALALH